MTSSMCFKCSDRLMVLAVHPDDESIAAGGLIQHAVTAGAAIRVIFITDGDNNPWPQRFVEKRWRIDKNDKLRWGRRRRKEALAALSVLGVNPDDAMFLGLPDQGITSLLLSGNTETMEQLKQEIAAWRPSVLLVPSLHDLHPDHNALAVMVDCLLQDDDLQMLHTTTLSYLVHGDNTEAVDGACIDLSLVQQLLKRVAILCHDSQMRLSRRRFLRHAQSTEMFYDLESRNDCSVKHPISDVVRRGDVLQILLTLTSRERFISGPMLFIVSGSARLALSLAHRTERAINLVDTVSDEVVGKATALWKGRSVQLDIPLGLFPRGTSMHLKLAGARHWGFFDRFGWRSLLLQSSVSKMAVDRVAIIPCFNVEAYCESVIRKAAELSDRVVVIDDGSTDGTADIISRLAENMPGHIIPLTFAANKGKGVGLIAGFRLALERFNFRCVITLDADGQHPPIYIPLLAEAIASGAEMAVGERDIRQMPGRSRLGNTLASRLLRWFYPSAPVDTQSGMRAFNQAFVEEIVEVVEGSRYETEFQILLLALSRHKSIAQVVIPTVYLDNNRSSKFRPIADSVRILGTLILWQLGFGQKVSA